MSGFDVLTLVLSGLALISSAFVAQRQLGASRTSDSTLVLLELLKEYRSPEMLNARARVIRHLDSSQFDPAGGFRGLPDEMRISVERVSHFFDQVGLLVSHKLAPTDALISFFGSGAMQFWQRLSPYLSAERALRQAALYQAYFEMFANLSSRRDPERLLIDIQRRMNRRGGISRLRLGLTRIVILVRTQLVRRGALASHDGAARPATLAGGTPLEGSHSQTTED